MRQSNLLQLIEALEEKDLRDLRKWLRSPMHNMREDVVILYGFIVKNIQCSPDKLHKHIAFVACYPGKSYREAQMNHLMSWLMEAIRDYLGWCEWKKDKANVHLARSRALRKLGQESAFEKECAQTQTVLEAESYRDEHFHTMSHLLHRERYEHASLQRRSEQAPLNVMAHHAAVAFRLNTLRYQCSMTVAKSMHTTQNIDDQLPDETSCAITLYENLLTALEDTHAEAAFFEAKRLLHRHWNLFRGAERRDLYLLALNFCIRKINGGQRTFMREAFDLYREGLENRALFEYGQLSRFTYKNAVTAGVNLGEFEWVRQFIEDYKTHLAPRERHSAYCYNLAIWYFWKSDYDQAMTLVQETDFADPLTNLDARIILLKIYYEREFYDALESHLDSFQAYLRRLKQIGYQRENYVNLIKITRKLLKIGVGDKAGKQLMLQEINATTALAERQWLLRQV